MNADTEKNIRTAAGVAAWAAMMAVSQESAALENLQRADFARYSDWRAHLIDTSPCKAAQIPRLGGSEMALICADALHLSSDRYEDDGEMQVTDTYLLNGATYTVHSGTIVAVFR